jgi:hypothetical protein
MNLNEDIVRCRIRFGPLHQRHPGRPRGPIRHYNRLHPAPPLFELSRRYSFGARVTRPGCSRPPTRRPVEQRRHGPALSDCWSSSLDDEASAPERRRKRDEHDWLIVWGREAVEERMRGRRTRLGRSAATDGSHRRLASASTFPLRGAAHWFSHCPRLLHVRKPGSKSCEVHALRRTRLPTPLASTRCAAGADKKGRPGQCPGLRKRKALNRVR